MSKVALDPGEALARVAGLEICHQTFGRPSDPPLLLITGLGAQMIVWEDDFCEALAARGFWVIRFDNRDIGKSTQIDWTPPADLGKAVAALRPGRDRRALSSQGHGGRRGRPDGLSWDRAARISSARRWAG